MSGDGIESQWRPAVYTEEDALESLAHYFPSTFHNSYQPVADAAPDDVPSLLPDSVLGMDDDTLKPLSDQDLASALDLLDDDFQEEARFNRSSS